MVSPGLSIAKASLLASCLRPDVTKLGRDDLASFHHLLETGVNECTPSNIQNTKAWLLQHILPSAVRTTAFTKYLTSLSKNASTISPEATCRPCRRQLHILYLINDIFHHTKHHGADESVRSNTRTIIPSILPDLFAQAAAEQKKGTTRRLGDLIRIWQSAKYCDQELLSQLRTVVSTGAPHPVQKDSKTEVPPSSKEQAWIMPSTHGHPNAPFFDLPAANLMPHIMPNSTRPMRPGDVRALQLVPGPADESLVHALKDFLKDVNAIDDPYAALEDEGIVPDIDEMGQITYKNEADDVLGDTYYGWSRAFCEKMKRRGEDHGHGRRGRPTHSNSSGSRSRSQSSRKRRRYSSSMSRSRSRSPSPRRNDSRPRLGAAAPSFSPNPQPRFGGVDPSHPSVHTQQQASPSAMSPFKPPPMGHNGMPLPPPRPQNWQGPWPPPPPPPLPHSATPPFSGMHLPPPPPQNFNQQHYGRR